MYLGICIYNFFLKKKTKQSVCRKHSYILVLVCLSMERTGIGAPNNIKHLDDGALEEFIVHH